MIIAKFKTLNEGLTDLTEIQDKAYISIGAINFFIEKKVGSFDFLIQGVGTYEYNTETLTIAKAVKLLGLRFTNLQ